MIGHSLPRLATTNQDSSVRRCKMPLTDSSSNHVIRQVSSWEQTSTTSSKIRSPSGQGDRKEMEFEATVYSNIHHLDRQRQQRFKDPRTVVEDVPDQLPLCLFYISTSFNECTFSWWNKSIPRSFTVSKYASSFKEEERAWHTRVCLHHDNQGRDPRQIRPTGMEIGCDVRRCYPLCLPQTPAS